MKHSIIFVLIFITFQSYCQSITGIVLDIDTQKPLSNVNVYLADHNNTDDTIDIVYYRNEKYKIIKKIETDSTGRYAFHSLADGIYNIIADYRMPISEMYNGYSSRQDIDSTIIVNCGAKHNNTLCLLVTCPYDKTKDQKECPQCNKSDMVVPILFGLPMFDENGGINGQPLSDFYLGGCFVDLYCNPTKHCNRCDKDF